MDAVAPALPPQWQGGPHAAAHPAPRGERTVTQRHFLAGFWRLADPKISLASFAGLFMAACCAARDSGLAPGWLALTVFGVFCVEVAKNASGEVVDFASGTDQAVQPGDRSPFSGGKRVLVDGLLTAAQCRAIAGGFFLAAIVSGLVIVACRDSRVLWLGIAGLALAWSYHGAPLRLAYRGWGELAVGIAYGPLVVCGAYLVQAGWPHTALLQASLALGLLVAAFLWINQFPDYRADRGAGKNNLVVRLGRERASTVFALIVAAGYLLLLSTGLGQEAARGMLWGLLGIVPASFAVLRLRRAARDTPRVVPAQAATLLSFLLMAAGSGLGYLLT
ncbi:MAG: 1,4-dihydroxy-2-naphthoate octaprenyltransferase [Halioglobus sp.]|nr:1,4-dihydroxy-2-naphthoate octaprenyltransferase [Halioglobus sp.]